MQSIHITCPKCEKIFEVNKNLLPIDGREVKCGSCGYIWFFCPEENKRTKITDIFLKYPTELPKDVEDLISDAENTN
tara:strand:- start:1208 stop:1438 length:231 start_codon:yes stop_codon:yes gene_type:complete